MLYLIVVPLPAGNSHLQLIEIIIIIIIIIINKQRNQFRIIFKVNLSCLIKHYAMKIYGGVDAQTHAYLTSALIGCEWSVSRPCRFTP
jgi:hypothetical protein